MSNTSATGGFLPLSPGQAAVSDEDVLQETIAALTELDGPMVRPRWQPKPPKQPADGIDWCAFGVIDDAPEGEQLIHGDDSAVLHQEALQNVMVSFYGPGAAERARRLRLGLAVSQNQAPMKRAGLVLVSVGAIVGASELVGQIWVRRRDVTLALRRADNVEVPIRNIVQAPVTLSNGVISTTTVVNS